MLLTCLARKWTEVVLLCLHECDGQRFREQQKLLPLTAVHAAGAEDDGAVRVAQMLVQQMALAALQTGLRYALVMPTCKIHEEIVWQHITAHGNSPPWARCDILAFDVRVLV